MNYCTSQINIKYQIVIPKEVRNIVHVEPNERIGVFPVDENTIILKKVPKSIKGLKGTWKFPKHYLDKERLSW